MSITKARLKLAAWLSLVNGLITIPYFAISVYFIVSSSKPSFIFILLDLFEIGIFLIIISSFRRLLNSNFNFHKIDKYILTLIAINILPMILSIINLIFSSILLNIWYVSLIISLSLIILLVSMIIYIIISVELLSYSGNIYGLKRILAYALVATSFCFATVILIPLGIIGRTTMFFIFAIIFFRAYKQTDVVSDSLKNN